MRNKIKMLKMCTMLLRFGLIHICSSDSSSANLSLIPLSITLTWMRDQTDRSVFFDGTEIAFIRQ